MMNSSHPEPARKAPPPPVPRRPDSLISKVNQIDPALKKDSSIDENQEIFPFKFNEDRMSSSAIEDGSFSQISEVENSFVPLRKDSISQYKSGYLGKLVGHQNSFSQFFNRGKGFPRRWAVLSETSCKLFYYKNKGDTDVLGEINISAAIFNYDPEDQEGLFTIESDGVIHHLFAGDETNRQDWLEELQSVKLCHMKRHRDDEIKNVSKIQWYKDLPSTSPSMSSIDNVLNRNKSEQTTSTSNSSQFFYNDEVFMDMKTPLRPPRPSRPTTIALSPLCDDDFITAQTGSYGLSNSCEVTPAVDNFRSVNEPQDQALDSMNKRSSPVSQYKPFHRSSSFRSIRKTDCSNNQMGGKGSNWKSMNLISNTANKAPSKPAINSESFAGFRQIGADLRASFTRNMSTRNKRVLSGSTSEADITPDNPCISCRHLVQEIGKVEDKLDTRTDELKAAKEGIGLLQQNLAMCHKDKETCASLDKSQLTDENLLHILRSKDESLVTYEQQECVQKNVISELKQEKQQLQQQLDVILQIVKAKDNAIQSISNELEDIKARYSLNSNQLQDNSNKIPSSSSGNEQSANYITSLFPSLNIFKSFEEGSTTKFYTEIHPPLVLPSRSHSNSSVTTPTLEIDRVKDFDDINSSEIKVTASGDNLNSTAHFFLKDESSHNKGETTEVEKTDTTTKKILKGFIEGEQETEDMEDNVISLDDSKESVQNKLFFDSNNENKSFDYNKNFGESNETSIVNYDCKPIAEKKQTSNTSVTENEDTEMSINTINQEYINLIEKVDTISKDRDRFQESFNAYKSQNAFLHRQIFEMSQASDAMKQREERLMSECHMWEAQYQQIKSKYLVLLNDLHSPLYQQHDRETLARMLTDVLSQSPDIRSVRANGREYDECGFCISAQDEETLQRCASFMSRHNRANIKDSMEEEKRAERSWESLLAGIGSMKSDGIQQIELKHLIREKGVPLRYRSRIWSMLVERHVGDKRKQLPETYYEDLLARCVLRESEEGNYCELDKKTKAQIELDLLRTLPNNRFYDSEYADNIIRLRRVLFAFALHNREVSYCQGINRLAAIALLFLPEKEAFWCLVCIVEHLMPEQYFTPKLMGPLIDQRTLRVLVEEKLPNLHNHLNAHGISTTMITFNWFLCLFVEEVPPAIYLHIWDSFLLEGSKVLFRYSLAILKLCEDGLLTKNEFMDVSTYLRSVPPSMGDIGKLRQAAFQWANPLSSRQIRRLRGIHRGEVMSEMAEQDIQREKYMQESRTKVNRGPTAAQLLLQDEEELKDKVIKEEEEREETETKVDRICEKQGDNEKKEENEIKVVDENKHLDKVKTDDLQSEKNNSNLECQHEKVDDLVQTGKDPFELIEKEEVEHEEINTEENLIDFNN